MSEYQYYEFQSVDRPLDRADREELRGISTRAQITASSFTNHYEWGDLKANPKEMMVRWFDLHLYLANWGSRRLMIRLPKRLVDSKRLADFLPDVGRACIINSGENIILDIYDNDELLEYDYEWDDGSGWLAALAPLRSDLLSGDWRLPYLIWLMAVGDDMLEDDEREPLRGVGPLNGGLEAFSDFFHLDPDLVRAAAEVSPSVADAGLSHEKLQEAVASMTEDEKTALLCRLAQGGLDVAAEIKNRIKQVSSLPTEDAEVELRTVSGLRARAEEIRETRLAVEAERREAERLRLERLEKKLRRARLNDLRKRGENVWQEIENEIKRRNASGYERAAALISDLRTLAEENGEIEAFSGRLNSLRLRHGRKKRFIELLGGLSKPDKSPSLYGNSE